MLKKKGDHDLLRCLATPEFIHLLFIFIKAFSSRLFYLFFYLVLCGQRSAFSLKRIYFLHFAPKSIRKTISESYEWSNLTLMWDLFPHFTPVQSVCFHPNFVILTILNHELTVLAHPYIRKIKIQTKEISLTSHSDGYVAMSISMHASYKHSWQLKWICLLSV